jgi:hypothetical protein
LKRSSWKRQTRKKTRDRNARTDSLYLNFLLF